MPKNDDKAAPRSPISEAAAAMGRLGAAARAKKLTKKRRSEIARMGALTRWGTRDKKKEAEG